MKNYKFTENWFRDFSLINTFSFLDFEKELHILEIGSFEGESTVWFLENVLNNPKSTITCIDPWTNYSQNSNSLNDYHSPNAEWDLSLYKTTFFYNIKESGFENKVITHQGLSQDILPKLITLKNKYDIIFIDGNHVAPSVLTDGVMSWYLLKENGIIIFDDYEWDPDNDYPSTQSPKLAVDSFIENFSDYSKVIWSGYRKVIKKIK